MSKCFDVFYIYVCVLRYSIYVLLNMCFEDFHKTVFCCFFPFFWSEPWLQNCYTNELWVLWSITHLLQKQQLRCHPTWYPCGREYWMPVDGCMLSAATSIPVRAGARARCWTFSERPWTGVRCGCCCWGANITSWSSTRLFIVYSCS